MLFEADDELPPIHVPLVDAMEPHSFTSCLLWLFQRGDGAWGRYGLYMVCWTAAISIEQEALILWFLFSVACSPLRGPTSS